MVGKVSFLLENKDASITELDTSQGALFSLSELLPRPELGLHRWRLDCQPGNPELVFSAVL